MFMWSLGPLVKELCLSYHAGDMYFKMEFPPYGS